MKHQKRVLLEVKKEDDVGLTVKFEFYENDNRQKGKEKKMKTILQRLKEELDMLKDMEKKADARLKCVPRGHIRVMEKRNKAQYYYRDAESSDERERSSNGRYLRKNERELIKKISQRDYDVQFMRAAEARRRAIERFVEVYEKTDLGEIYSKTNKYRRELISPLVISDEEYVRQWLAVEYPRMGFGEDAPEFISERGERVRSKSEKIIADKLYSMGIPYRYEYPIVLEGNIRKCPDFTILKMPEREVVYLEHLGMMDKADYLEDTMYKWNLYEKNGIHLGVNLLITHETSRYPLNTRVLDEMLREVFVKENG